MRTRSEQNIEQVALIVAESLQSSVSVVDIEQQLTELRDYNDMCGYGFDVRYDDIEYISNTAYTRVEDVHLDDAEWDRAVELATAWLSR
jgi:hypothetical protein